MSCIRNTVLAALLLALIGVALPAHAKGEHKGEQKQLDVAITFSKPSGETVTSGDGIYYKYSNGSYTYENKVYPEAYWGSYPLYFFGEEVQVAVNVTNNGPRKKFKLQITTEAFVLKTDGSSGVALADPQTIAVEIARGETKKIDASFVAENRDGAESGLDRFLVSVRHENSSGNPDAGLILVKEGVFCPPENAEGSGTDGDDLDELAEAVALDELLDGAGDLTDDELSLLEDLAANGE